MSYATFDAIKIGIASPEMIREWSYGEVKKPEVKTRPTQWHYIVNLLERFILLVVQMRVV